MRHQQDGVAWSLDDACIFSSCKGTMGLGGRNYLKESFHTYMSASICSLASCSGYAKYIELVRKRHLKRYVEGFYSCRTTIYLVVSCDLGAVIVLVFVLCESGIF